MCKINEVGQLCVRGTSLALGYYNDEKKTNEVFIQNPLNKLRLFQKNDSKFKVSTKDK